MNKINIKKYLWITGLLIGGFFVSVSQASSCSVGAITKSVQAFPKSGENIGDFQKSASDDINALNKNIRDYQGCWHQQVTGSSAQSDAAPYSATKALPKESQKNQSITEPGSYLNPAQPKAKKEPGSMIKWFN
jgi:hypothetical protein